MNKKRGFTLAEVLLTLVIIGVVAALTIPAVITKVTQDQYVVGLKKAYNTLKSVEREAIQENGPMANWGWSGVDQQADFETYFKPHFDILKDCAMYEDGCMGSEYHYLGGMAMSYYFNTYFYKFITSDGITYAFTSGNDRGKFYVDVNGPKGPNVMGRDLFAFNVFSNYGIKPFGSYFSNSGSMPSSGDIENSCNPSMGNGEFCAVKVLSEGAMNY